MAEPTAPQIPNDAPQDVKDFFDCKASTLNWQSGDVAWLGLKVTPSVTFAPGANCGEVNITVGLLGGMVGFTLPASVNVAGELVVDTSSVPDLSEWGLGGRADIDAAIKRVNDWFKHNGKKLKPARLAGGTVVLEKTPIGPPAATGKAVTTPTPVPAPVQTIPPKAAPAAAAPPPAQSSSGVGCSLLGMLLLVMLIGVMALGGGIGFVFFGGPGTGVGPTATPTAPPTVTTAPGSSAGPTTSALATLTARPSSTAAPPSPTPQPTPSKTLSVFDMITALCTRVVHRQYQSFLSYIEWLMYWDGYDVDHFVVRLTGANNGSPVDLVFDATGKFWTARLGLLNPGNKELVSFVAVLDDGTPIDITEAVAEILGESLNVRYPQEDTFGDCAAFE